MSLKKSWPYSPAESMRKTRFFVHSTQLQDVGGLFCWRTIGVVSSAVRQRVTGSDRAAAATPPNGRLFVRDNLVEGVVSDGLLYGEDPLVAVLLAAR